MKRFVVALGWLVWAITASTVPNTLARADVEKNTVERFHVLLDRWDLNSAKAMLDDLRDGPERDSRAGELAFYEADYATAERLLAGALATGPFAEDDPLGHEIRHYLALARGARQALGPAIRIANHDGTVEIVFAHDKDTLLAPYLFDAMAEARTSLANDLGIAPDHTVRIEILDDPAKLAMVTPLTLDNVYTTGTVGITKYRRIVLLTPRVMVYGYGWLDAAVHEYVHYLLTLRTKNRAPVWLQEGLAKLLETRWRASKPPSIDAPTGTLLHRAIVRDDLVTLAEMYPSVAMLPSQERAALAYAEVETMLGLLLERRGPAGIGQLLERVAAGEEAQEAFSAAWGDTFERFLAHWKTTVLARTRAHGKGEIKKKQFKVGSAEPESSDPSLFGDVFSHLGGGRARQHARLGVLLTLRGHIRPAVLQYEKARRADRLVRNDAKLARRLGELYLELGAPRKALPLLELAARDDLDNANLAATEGRARVRVGDHDGARRAIARAVRQNPFIGSIHCDLAKLALDPEVARREQSLCRETQQRGSTHEP